MRIDPPPILVSALHRPLWRAAVLAAIFCGAGLAGCATGEEMVTTLYADPAKYDLYNCTQLRTAKRNWMTRIGEVEALMNKARTGAGGAVIAEAAYRNDYNSARAQYNLADRAWQRNRCDSERLTPEKLPPAGAQATPRDQPASVQNDQNDQLKQIDSSVYGRPPER